MLLLYLMQIFANSVFQGFIRELSKSTPKCYFNGKRVIQSSVGMIFRVHTASQFSRAEEVGSCAFDKIQLLFTQRAGYEGDHNAYNIVFPGGQCDQDQSDLSACKRELFEEIGIKVDEQCIYLGQIPSNFYYLQKRKKNVYITCHIWCLNQSSIEWKQRLNASQLCDSKWVDLSELLMESNYVIENSLRLGILERIASKYKLRIIADVSKNVLSISTPELNLGMGRNLWGLTLWIWSYALQMACVGILDGSDIDKDKLSLAKAWINKMQNLQVKFKEGFLLKYPSLAVIKSWHYFNRVRPFTYKPGQQLRIKIYVLAAVLLGIIMIILL